MTTPIISISRANALKAYNSADENGKSLLVNLFGRELLRDITDRVWTVKDACRELDIYFDRLHENVTDPYRIAQINIETFAEALREGKPASECYYAPWFSRSGGGFSYYNYDCGSTFSGVGARLRVDTPEKAKHLGKCLIEDYKVYMKG